MHECRFHNRALAPILIAALAAGCGKPADAPDVPGDRSRLSGTGRVTRTRTVTKHKAGRPRRSIARARQDKDTRHARDAFRRDRVPVVPDMPIGFDSERALFDAALRDYVSSGRYPKAKALYLSALREQPGWIENNRDPIMQAFLERGDYAAAREWADELIDESLPSALAVGVFRNLVSALDGMNRIDRFASYVPALFEKLMPAQVALVVGAVLQSAVDRCDQRAFDAVVGMLGVYCRDPSELAPIIADRRVRMLIGLGDCDEASRLLMREADKLGKSGLGQLAVLVLNRWNASGRFPEQIDRLVHRMLAEWAGCPEARTPVARWWLRDAHQRKDYDALLVRFCDLVMAEIDPQVITSALGSSYYEIRTHGTPEQQSICGSLLKAISSVEGLGESDRQRFALMRLDEGFFDDDFSGMLAMVDDGIPGQDEEWHAFMRNKLAAHVALQYGRKEEAIARFRRHMDALQQGDMPLIDPSKGQKVHLDVVLGLNEKRIGDIYLSMRREHDARLAYSRAREHCTDVLNDPGVTRHNRQEANRILSETPATDAAFRLR